MSQEKLKELKKRYINTIRISDIPVTLEEGYIDIFEELVAYISRRNPSFDKLRESLRNLIDNICINAKRHPVSKRNNYYQGQLKSLKMDMNEANLTMFSNRTIEEN